MLRDLAALATLAGIGWLIHRTHRLETRMTAQNDKLTALATSLGGFFDDVDAKLDQLNAQTEDFNPEAQATFDALKATVAAKHAEIGDADGSDTPAEPEQPATPNV